MSLMLYRASRNLVEILLDILHRYPWQCALCFALGLAWWQCDRAEQWQVHSQVEAANHRQTKENYRAATAEAKAKAVAARLETERRFAALAKDADDANENVDRWRAAARRYADAGGLLIHAGTGAGGTGSGAGTSGADRAPSGDDGPGQAPVVLSRADFDTLTVNTDRLLRLHDLGQQWIASGLAVPAEQGP